MILLISDLSQPFNNGWYYKTGFEKNGYKVISFDPKTSYDPINKVFKLTKEFRPDFILHTKYELPVDVFQELRQYAKVIMWYPDPVISEQLIPYVQSCDFFLTMAEGLVVDFRRYNQNSFWLTQAFEPSFFEIKEITSQDIKAFSSDITFVGNLGSKEQYLSRRDYLKKVAQLNVKLKWWGPKIPRKITTIPLIIGKLGRSYGGKFIWGEEYAKVCRLSKIFLAFDSMPYIKKSMSARMYTAVGCGAFYMCQHVEGIEDVLIPDKEIVTFHDENEMIDKIGFYLKREDLRRKISQAGQEKVLKNHTYEIRIRQLIRIVENVFFK
jgi:spore maturation protein CgeB